MTSILSKGFIEFDTTAIVLSDSDEYSLSYKYNGDLSRLTLALDVYGLNYFNNPEEHLGWWAFPIDGISGKGSGRLIITGDDVNVLYNDMPVLAQWVSETRSSAKRLLMLAVVKDRDSSEILFLSKVQIFFTKVDCQDFIMKSLIDWNKPRFLWQSHQFY